MFFAKPGEYEPSGMFSIEHFSLLALTFLIIVSAVKHTKNDKKLIKKRIQIVTLGAWILEIIKIIFNLSIGNKNNINTYIPLYYCSILLYAGIFSSFGNGVIKKVGDVFLATGGLVGGIIFLILPTTSITIYPMFHYISIQSFLYHGAMIYLGIIINKYKYIDLNYKDISYYASLIFFVCIIAYIINNLFDSNLMFISKNFPGSPIEIIYKLLGKYFTLFMCLIQIVGPFYVSTWIIKHIEGIKTKSEDDALLASSKL